MPGEEIIGHVAITALIHLMEKLAHVKFLSCRLWRPNAEVRVSISAILAIPDGGGLLLVRNLRRPEAFGPLGGVYKCYEEARPELEKMLFRPEDIPADIVMKGDLRGFLPRRCLGRFISWFERKEGRELSAECLRRELVEELNEIGMVNPRVPEQLPLRRIRVVSEGPETVPGIPYMQFRLLEIYALSSSGRQMEEFLRRLILESQKNENLVLASTSEIVTGRTRDGNMITHHSAYLIGNKRIRPEIPTFSRNS